MNNVPILVAKEHRREKKQALVRKFLDLIGRHPAHRVLNSCPVTLSALVCVVFSQRYVPESNGYPRSLDPLENWIDHVDVEVVGVSVEFDVIPTKSPVFEELLTREINTRPEQLELGTAVHECVVSVTENASVHG